MKRNVASFLLGSFILGTIVLVYVADPAAGNELFADVTIGLVQTITSVLNHLFF